METEERDERVNDTEDREEEENNQFFQAGIKDNKRTSQSL